MKIGITREQYDLIREALEQYYYICKDDSETRHKLSEIDELEDSLINQSQYL